MTVLPQHVVDHATHILAAARMKNFKIVTAESCTGGLIAAVLTDVPGSSDVFERGYITYSNLAKQENLGVPYELIDGHGAVSEEVARAMAAGALIHSDADLSLSVTGVAGPTGGTKDKPIGTVHLACGRYKAEDEMEFIHEEHHFGDVGRALVRLKTVEAALKLIEGWVS